MTKKQFDIDDLFSIWNTKPAYKDEYFEKLYLESNPILTETFNMARTLPVVVDVKKMVQKYVGLDPKNWWGWSLDEMFGEGVKSYMALIHPEDLVVHEQINYLLFETLATCSQEEKHQLRILFNFRLKKSDGSYIEISQLTRIVELDSEGNIQTLLVLLQEINYINVSRKCYIRFWGIPAKEKLYEYRLLNQELVELGTLTERETEIARHVVTGQESQAIAHQLFISKHTIDTHRRRILQKFQLKNTQELMHFVFVTRLLDSY